MGATISDEYKTLNHDLHLTHPEYGTSGAKAVPLVLNVLQVAPVKTILDYGCGKGTFKPAMLAKRPDLEIFEYDPAIPEKDAAPAPADLILCGDVLEHVEPAHLVQVLGEIRALMKVCGVFVVHLGPAVKTLPDGRNAHLIQKPVEWWAEQLASLFTVHKAVEIAADEQSEGVFVVGL
jgi:2-polyprenyl-3-methyl-5-hydroxy-6-metoxy-1,4-benzoquinol methylase